MIDAESLEILNIAIADWDDNNASDDDYEESREKLEEIYYFISDLVTPDEHEGEGE